jgi:hypothetical protein
MAKIRITRWAAGSYNVTDGTRNVSVFKTSFWDGDAWIASLDGDRYGYSDPLPTKRVAVECAREMLSEARS